MNNQEMYFKMLLIRKTEEKIEELFSKGLLRGTTHGAKGQEAVAVGLLSHIDCNFDYITGSHRSHGHYLAINPDPYPLFAELMGKETGLVNGKGGSQHILYKNFITNGITGGMVPIATGLAFSQKVKTKDGICISLFGDGAMNEGYVMEALNLAAVLELPIVFALENNNYAMSTPFSYSCRGKIEDRIHGFGLDYHQIEAIDVETVSDKCKDLISIVRTTRKPIFIEFKTHRFSGHSESDKREYVDPCLDEYWHKNDPLLRIENKLDPKIVIETNQKVENMIKESVERAIEDAYPMVEGIEYENL